MMWMLPSETVTSRQICLFSLIILSIVGYLFLAIDSDQLRPEPAGGFFGSIRSGFAKLRGSLGGTNQQDTEAVGWDSSLPKVMCMIFTTRRNWAKKAAAVRITWSRHCYHRRFFYSRIADKVGAWSFDYFSFVFLLLALCRRLHRFVRGSI
jgi:hypothetical protein